ncbi:penicillin-binding protein 2 [Candidatus Hepatincola sp. Pdp]
MLSKTTEIKVAKSRIKIVAYFIFLLFIVAVIKLVYLSVLGFYQNYVFTNTQIKSNIRYDILDRNNNVLAINIPSVSVYLRPKEITNKPLAVRALRDSLRIQESIAHKLVYADSPFVWVKRNISAKEEKKLRYYGVIGIYFSNEKKRFYPYGSLFSHTVGMTNLDGVGVSGIENSLNNELTKHNVTLSLDLGIQRIVYEALAKAKNLNKAKRAYAMVANPKTGEVLALVSLPDYNPNYRHDINIGNMFNYPTQGLFEPGSIAKVFSVAMALDNGDHKIYDTYDVSKPIVKNSYLIVDYDYMDRTLTIPEILMYSSNIGTSILMREIGIFTQKKYLKRFGILNAPPLEITENTAPLVPSVWNQLNSMTISYGYGIAMSQATFLNAFLPIINGGIYTPLTLLKKSANTYGNGYGKRIISKEVSREMRAILRLVVAKGYGRKADVKGYLVGGKTGSSEKQVNGHYNKDIVFASFLAFFPADDPQYAILVTIDEPKRVAANNFNVTGGYLSAPVVAEIVEKIGINLGIAKQKDDLYTKVNSKKVDTVLQYVEDMPEIINY